MYRDRTSMFNNQLHEFFENAVQVYDCECVNEKIRFLLKFFLLFMFIKYNLFLVFIPLLHKTNSFLLKYLKI